MSNSARDPVERSQEIYSVVCAFEDMNQKYDFPPREQPPGAKDAHLPILDMATKSEILETLQFSLLPAIIKQILSLVKSVEDLEEEYPNPDVELTLGILSNLDQRLRNTVSLTVALADGSPLLDEKNDCRLEKMKSFRCSQLRSKIKGIVEWVANSLLQFFGSFMRSCAMAILGTDPAWAWEEAASRKQAIPKMAAGILSSIHDTIVWSLLSDWAIIRREWLMTVDRLDEFLEDLTKQAHPSSDSTPDLARLTISPTDDHDQVEQALLQTRRTAVIEQTAEVARSIIPLVKLARILVNKLLKMIPHKLIFEPDTRINSETLGQLHAAFGSMTAPIMSIVCHVRIVQSSTHFTMADARRNVVLSLKNELMTTLETTSTNIASRLMPLLHGAEHALHASDFKAWSLTLEQPWNEVVGRSLDLVSSFGSNL
ncbi:hypothetical protein KEM48_004003 [Puccinia striiformis f. sp. tritici PST-130]|nr:hypothetical protein KEM48_004003 [Puccinia striiformis f. sp. tritici PST-130]